MQVIKKGKLSTAEVEGSVISEGTFGFAEPKTDLWF